VRDILQSVQLGVDFTIAPMLFDAVGKNINIIWIVTACFNGFGLILLLPFYFWYRKSVLKLPVDDNGQELIPKTEFDNPQNFPNGEAGDEDDKEAFVSFSGSQNLGRSPRGSKIK
jgi:hypothetical protein